MVEFARAHPAKLTPKQVECLHGVWRGLQLKEIGAELGLSARTVETHLKKARETLGAATSVQAARAAAAQFGWVRDGAGEGLNRIPPQDRNPLSWGSPEAALSAVTTIVDHEFSLPQRWLVACGLAAAIAVAAVVALLALGAVLTLLSRQLPSPRSPAVPAAGREGSKMSKTRQDTRQSVAVRISMRLHSAEGLLDDGLCALSTLLAELPVQRKEAELSATFGQSVFVELAAAQQALVSARGHLVGAHEALAQCRDQLRLQIEIPPGEDKPPPSSFAVPEPLRLVG